MDIPRCKAVIRKPDGEAIARAAELPTVFYTNEAEEEHISGKNNMF